jgi:hypothetical protein
MLNEERPSRKVQNRKTVFTAAAIVMNGGKTIPRQHQNVTGFSMENTEIDCMNPVSCMGCSVSSCGRDEKRKMK